MMGFYKLADFFLCVPSATFLTVVALAKSVAPLR